MTPPPTDLYEHAARAGYEALGYRDLYAPAELDGLATARANDPDHRAVVDHVWAAAQTWLAQQLTGSATAVASMRGAADLDQRRAHLAAQYGDLIAQRPGMGTEPGA